MSLADLRSDDVVIDHLKIIAPAGMADRVRQALELASWPQVPDRGWVFIRSVHVRSPGAQLAQCVAGQTRTWMECPGGTGANAQVVRFASFEALLVSLLTDLAHGRASRCWYWRRWSYLFERPAGRAMADLMEAHIDYLPTVTAGLAKTRELGTVWQGLGKAEALRLIAVVARRFGLDWPQVTGRTEREAESGGLMPALPEQPRQRWQAILRMLPIDDPRRDLALLLIGQECFPRWLQQSPLRLMRILNSAFDRSGQPEDHAVPAARSTPVLRTASRDRNARDRVKESAMIPEEEAGLDQKQAQAPSGGPSRPSIEAATAPTVASAGRDHASQDLPESGAHGPPQTKPVPAATTTEPHPNKIGEAHPEADHGPRRPMPKPEKGLSTAPLLPLQNRVRLEEHPMPPALDGLETAQGGLFFLLNFLKRDDVQHLLAQPPAVPEWTSGWGWLFRLGQELALDESDPVIGFLARQLGLSRDAQLIDLPPLPAREQLLDLALHLYGRVGLWRPELLRLKAAIHYTASHVDWYAPLSSVRLPVRLAGLDLNPGWLPWLGKVVTFHYER